MAKLANNENNYGIPDSVMQAMTEHWKYAGRYGYPDPGLNQAIAEFDGVKPENVMVTAGSGEVLDVVGTTFLQGGKKVLGVEPSYGSVYQHATSIKSEAIKLPLTKDYRQDIGMIIDLRDENEARMMPDDLDGLDVRVRRLPVFEGSGASQGERGISLEALYHRIVTQHSPILVDAVRTLPSAGDRAVVVHCTAGKDRTGMVVAMALLAAGVDRESVIADYVLTETHLAGEWLEEMVTLIGRYGIPDTPALRTGAPFLRPPMLSKRALTR